MEVRVMGAVRDLILVFAVLLNAAAFSNGGITSSYVRKVEASVDMPFEAFPPSSGYNAPEQVHITQGDRNGRSVIVSWVTPLERHPSVVKFWVADGDHKHKHKAHGIVTSYRYYNYTSGYIHHATIKKLKSAHINLVSEPSTRPVEEHIEDTSMLQAINNLTQKLMALEAKMDSKFDEMSGSGKWEYSEGHHFHEGDLGQTYDSNQTLEHYMSNPKGQAVLFAGDLSYADHYPNNDNRRWDLWGRFVEKSTAYQSWIWTAGNHELDFSPEIERVSNVRYNITNGLCTPVKGASAPVYITIGDGGNIEGLATSFTEPQPSYSAFREASFGHALLEIKNRTHAYYTWHRNHDSESVASESLWFYNRHWYPHEESSFASTMA
ncbi:hypothetical protein HHK36_010204 [Tetracentron sinense]|uniref:Purple acid phosphatase n=1 Tax=Tetracentron sinense TaxID=13715 RepID=A0A835DJ16_TETSI|nr:hypothetical protein HHK36_010204 [Tetracentron sinense]